jgi:hypothetical protein
VNGWVDDNPLLSLEQLFGLLRKPEIAEAFGRSLGKSAARKADQLEALRAEFADSRDLGTWYAACDDRIYQIRITALCDRMRLMFFGNLHQDWSEFVLSDLGIFNYEKVAFPTSSRAFRIRGDVDDYLHLYRCRERFEQGEPPDEVLQTIPAHISGNDWIEKRRAKLLFQIAQHYEQIGELNDALRIYLECAYEGARLRAIRVMEKSGQFESAFELAQTAQKTPESDMESQHLLRILPRLRRRLGHPKLPIAPAAATTTIALTLPRPDGPFNVEDVVRDHLTGTHQQAPVHYVENTLINSLFGLLCWNAVFTPLPGAFFHPFHTGPVDMLSTDFHRRRAREFTTCLSQLDSEQYQLTIRQHFIDKAGIQSPFVYWEILTQEMLELALACIPAAHLKKWFERMLLDIKSNRAGFPDLIQFWPEERRYRMIEVKGPGDRLQDNQIRWIDFCAAHDMPVAVCYVQWLEEAA